MSRRTDDPLDGVEAAIVDLDGTVYRGESLVPGADDALAALDDAGIDVLFVSNNAGKRPADYRAKLRRLGVSADPDRVTNAAEISAAYLARTHPDALAFVVGREPLVDELERHGVRLADDPADCDVVLLSRTETFDYGTLHDVLRAWRAAEPPIYATNPDRTIPVDGGEIPGTGAVIGAVEGLTGEPIDRVLGKPSRVTSEWATDRLGVSADEYVVIGDRLDTDVEMGATAGMRTVLVLSGVTGPDHLERAEPSPDLVLPSLSDLAELVG